MAERLADSEYGADLALAGPAFSVLDGESVIACIGVAEHSQYRAEAWALLSSEVGPHLRFITRAVIGWLQQTSYSRVDTLVSAEFKQGHRWARLLGFEQEGPVRPFIFPNGTDGVTYVRFKHGSPSSSGAGISGDRPDPAGRSARRCGQVQRPGDGEPGADGQ